MKLFKKQCFFTFCIFIIIASLYSNAFAYDSISFDFEQYAISTQTSTFGWIPGGAAASSTVQTDPDNSLNKTMKLSRGESEIGVGAWTEKAITPITGKFSVKWDMYFSDALSYKQFLLVGNDMNNQANAAFVMHLNSNGDIGFANTVMSTQLSQNTWYSFEVYVDLDEGTNGTVYVLCNDKILTAINSPLQKKFPLSQKMANVTSIRYVLSAVNNTTMYVDNIQVQEILNTIQNVPVINNTVSVADAGGIPNDNIDDSIAINAAITTAINNGPGTTVIFASGTYNLDNPIKPCDLAYIEYSNANGLTLSGNNTKLLFKEAYYGSLQFTQSDNLTITGFILDYNERPWAQGHVEAINAGAGTFDYHITDGSDVLFANDIFKKNVGLFFGMAMDSTTPTKLKQNCNDFFRPIVMQELGGGIFRFTLDSTSIADFLTYGNLQVGDNVIINNRGMSGSSFNLDNCSNVSITYCTVNASPGCILVSTYTEGTITIDNIQVLRKSGNWITSNADGFHMQSNVGNVVITNNILEGLADDCINLYATPGYVYAVASSTSVTLSHWARVPKAGETITIFEANNQGNIKGKSKVLSVTPSQTLDPDKFVDVILETPISNMLAGSSVTTADNFYIEECKFNGSLIANNIFRESRRHGVILATTNTTLQNNDFIELGGTAINIYCYGTGQGFNVDGLTITENFIQNTGYLDKWNVEAHHHAPIEIGGLKDNYSYISGQIQKNITISNNTIYNPNAHFIAIRNADGVTLSGTNTLIATSADGSVGANSSSIYVENSNNITLNGFSLQDLRPGLYSGVYSENNATNVSLNNNTYNLTSGAVTVHGLNNPYSMDFESVPLNTLSTDPSIGFNVAGHIGEHKVLADNLNRSLYLTRGIGTVDPFYMKTISKIYADNVVMEFKVKTVIPKFKQFIGVTDNVAAFVLNYSGDSTGLCSVNNITSNISGYNDGNWHTYKFIINIPRDGTIGTVDFYYDDILKLENITLYNQVSYVNKLYFSVAGGSSATDNEMYLDDIAVYDMLNPVVYQPISSPLSGNLTSSDRVTLSSTTNGASIYYTTDGTIPNTSSNLYTGPFAINGQNIFVRAYAVKAGSTQSFIKTFGPFTLVLSSECNVVSSTVPANATIGTNTITATVPYATTSITVNVTPSTGATWKLYSDASCTNEITNKVMNLSLGANTAYIKVTAEDTITTKIYMLTVTRAAFSVEVENLTTTTSTGDSHAKITDSNCSGGFGDKLTANATNDYVQYTVNVPTAGTYTVYVKVKKAVAQGKFQLAIDGTNQGTTQDLYSSSTQYVELNLGSKTFSTAGNKLFRFKVNNKNTSSTRYDLFIDAITLQ